MKKAVFALMVFGIISCTKDRDIPDLKPKNFDLKIIHYWNFNALSGFLNPNVSSGGASLAYRGNGADLVGDGTELNAMNLDTAGNALRLRNPAGDFILKMPTTGFKNIFFSFATMRTNSGARIQNVFYSINGEDFTQSNFANASYGVTEDFLVQLFNFSEIEGVNDNPNFTIKITFEGNADGPTGNNRFDNILLEGESLGGMVIDTATQLLHLWHFNNLPADTISGAITADESFSNNAKINYTGTGLGWVDRTDGTMENAQHGQFEGFAVRFRNPSENRAVVMDIPTNGYEKIAISFATTRTNSGATVQRYAYSINGTDYIDTDLPIKTYEPSFSEYTIVKIDLSQISGVNNNPNFKFRITFEGSNAASLTGNNRFDNIAVEGKKL